MFIYGIHSVSARLRESPQTISRIYVHTSTNPKIFEIESLARKLKINCQTLSRDKFAALTKKNVNHQGVICECEGIKQQFLSLQDFLQNNEENNLQILMLDQVHDPHNLGACMRSADAFGCSAIIVPKDRSANMNEAVIKAACGAAETVPILTVTNLARALDEIADERIETLGLALEGKTSLWNYSNKKLGKRVCWVLGGEENGLRRLTREKCMFLLNIPMSGNVESLNVSVSAALCLAEYHKTNNK